MVPYPISASHAFVRMFILTRLVYQTNLHPSPLPLYRILRLLAREGGRKAALAVLYNFLKIICESIATFENNLCLDFGYKVWVKYTNSSKPVCRQREKGALPVHHPAKITKRALGATLGGRCSKGGSERQLKKGADDSRDKTQNKAQGSKNSFVPPDKIPTSLENPIWGLADVSVCKRDDRRCVTKMPSLTCEKSLRQKGGATNALSGE